MSGSDSVEVRVSADISALKAQLAEAQANVKQFSTAVDALTAAAKTYGTQASIEAQLQKDQAALDEARAKVTQLASEIQSIEAPAAQASKAVEGIAPAADHGRVATAGMAREFIVLGHEVVSGNFSRIPGSLMVLAERTGGLTAALAAITPEILGIGAAVITVTGLFAAWAIQAAKVEAAVKAASVAAVEAGRSGPGARQQVEQGGQQISGAGTLSTNQSTILAASISQLNDLTDEQRQKVVQLGAAFAAMFDGNITETTKFISKTFESDTALKSYLDRFHLLGPEGQRAWDQTTDAAQRFDIGIQAITARLGPAFEQYRQLNDAATIARANTLIQGPEGGMPIVAPAQQPSVETRGNIPQQSSALIDNTAAQMGVTQAIANFATRIAQVESHGQQVGGPGTVKGPNDVTTSSAGALGMMQVMPDSTQFAGGSATQRTVNGQAYDLTDPIQNVKAGLAILAQLFQQFGGDQYKVAVGYNAGPRVANGEVRQSPVNQRQTAGYTAQLGLSPGGGAAPSPFRPNMGETEPGTTGDAAGERSQRITDENDYQVKIAQIDGKLQDQQKQLAQDEAAVAAASQMAAGTERDAAMSAANARVAAVQRSIAALTEERNMVRSPADAGVARQAEVQISTAKLANAQATNDPKEAAIANAQAEMDAYRQAASAAGISDAAKQQFDEKYQQASVALINARRAAEGTWSEQQRADLDAITAKVAQAGGDRQQIELRVSEATKQFWQSVVATTTLTTDQRRQAEEQLSISTRRFAEESATAAKEASDKALRTTETRLAAEAAASRGNLTQIIAIEQQRVDAVRAVHGSESAEYFTALEQQTNAVRSAVEQQVRTEEQASQRRIASETQTLRAQADAHQITKQAEMQQLEAFVAAERDADLGSLTSLLGTLTEGTAAYKAAFDARNKLAEQFQIQLQALHTKEVQAAQQAADQTTKAYESAFAAIGSSGNRAIEGLIEGHMSWLKAAQTVTQGIVSSMLTLTETLIARWTAYEAAKLLADTTTQNTINTVQSTSAASGWPQLIASWLGLEAAKTAATTAGAATRASADGGAGLATSLSQVAARWSATEATKTGLTAAGAATRATADSGAGLSADLSQVIARWSAAEASKTVLTTTAATTRATVDSGTQLSAELAQVVARWSATEASKTALTTGGAATRGTVDGGVGLTASLSQVVAKWSATEATKTALTTTGAATRATADTSGGFLASVAQILARWLGLETAKTAATTAQGAARTAAEATAATAGAQLVGVQARLQIAAAAAEAAAWAFADSASLGPPGLAAAPGAAAAAEATVMSFQALVPLATGAWNIPQTTPALLHAGEMVVPQTFASGIRSAGGVVSGMNSGGNTQNVTLNHTANVSGNTGNVGPQLRQSDAFMKSFVGNATRNGNLTPPRWFG